MRTHELRKCKLQRWRFESILIIEFNSSFTLQLPPMRPPPQRTFVNEDRYVKAKHTTVYPSPEQLDAVQSMVSNVECAVKSVSDWLNEKESSAADAGRYGCWFEKSPALMYLDFQNWAFHWVISITVSVEYNLLLRVCAVLSAVLHLKVNCVVFWEWAWWLKDSCWKMTWR